MDFPQNLVFIWTSKKEITLNLKLTINRLSTIVLKCRFGPEILHDILSHAYQLKMFYKWW